LLAGTQAGHAKAERSSDHYQRDEHHGAARYDQIQEVVAFGAPEIQISNGSSD
jgi:hypothetical protein